MGLISACGMGILIGAANPISQAQKPAGELMLSSGELTSGDANGQGEVLLEIDDPANGDRWLLHRNEQNPAGPGRLLRIAGDGARKESHRAATVTEPGILPVIHTGDRIIVEEHSRVVDSFLEARALNPAAAGAAIDLRLTIGGKILRAVAIGPGRARIQPERGVRP